MQINVRTLAAVGVAYMVGYSRGMTASEQIGDRIAAGLETVGEGLKAIAVEIGVEYKQNAETRKEVENLPEETKDQVRKRAQGGTTTNAQIAQELNISEAAVALILTQKEEKTEAPEDDVQDATVVDEEPTAPSATGTFTQTDPS